MVDLQTVTEPRSVPVHIVRPPYVTSGRGPTHSPPQIQDAESLVRLRRASQVAAEVLETTGAAVTAGITTDELDAIAHAAYIERGAYPSTLHYPGHETPFVKSICTSVNGVICHGVPDQRPLIEGDIVNIDVTAYIDGMHGDTSATFAVGRIDFATQGLIDTTREATLRGIASCHVGASLGVVGETIEPFAQSRGYDIVREYGGHGIGAIFHALPHVNHTIVDEEPFVLTPGLTLTVEPMLTTGSSEFYLGEDGWTEHIGDSMVSAQFEHTIIIAENGPEILTLTAGGQSPAGTLADLSKPGASL